MWPGSLGMAHELSWVPASPIPQTGFGTRACGAAAHVAVQLHPAETSQRLPPPLPWLAFGPRLATVAFSDASSDALPPAVKDAGAAIGAVQEEADQRRLRGASVEEKSEVEDTGVVASERALSKKCNAERHCDGGYAKCEGRVTRTTGCNSNQAERKCKRWCR